MSTFWDDWKLLKWLINNCYWGFLGSDKPNFVWYCFCSNGWRDFLILFAIVHMIQSEFCLVLFMHVQMRLTILLLQSKVISISLSPNLWLMTFTLDLDLDLGLTIIDSRHAIASKKAYSLFTFYMLSQCVPYAHSIVLTCKHYITC